jgi:hypothetical protein
MRLRWLVLAALGPPCAAEAQTAVSSDLWRVAMGTLTEPAALLQDGTAPFWTPAVTLPGGGPRFRFGAEAVHGPSEVGVNGGILTFTARPGGWGTLSVSYGWIGLGDVAYTETSPEALGGSVPVWSQQASVGFAGKPRPDVALGMTLRYVGGRIATLEQSQVGLDLGLQVTAIPHLRLGIATHFLDPGFSSNQRAAGGSAGAEYASSRFVLWGTDAAVMARYGVTLVQGEDLQHLLGGGVRMGPLTLDLAAVHEAVADDAVWRSRLGVTLRSGRYRIQIGRDGGVNAFGPAYRFGLTMVFR